MLNWLTRTAARTVSKVVSVLSKSPAPQVGPGPASSAYWAANLNKLDKMWTPSHRSGDAAVREAWDLLTSRCRDAVRNSPVLRKASLQMTSLVVGSGLRTYADAQLPDGTQIDDFNDESDAWFFRWAEGECDAEGERSLWQMQQQSFSDMLETGNSFWLMINQRRNDRVVNLAFKLLEFEQLCKSNDGSLDNGHYVLNGIEFDRQGRKVAYHFWREHPYHLGLQELSSNDVVRVPANRVLHNYVSPRPSQRCGVSWFAPAIMPERDLDWLVHNKLTTAGIQALMTLVFKSNTQTFNEIDSEEYRNNPVRFGHANVCHVGVDDKVELVQSQNGDVTQNDFMDMVLNRLAMSTGLSMQRLEGNAQRSNFAGIKASHRDDGQLFKPMQDNQVKFHKRIRKLFNAQAVGLGVITSVSASNYLANRFRYDQLEASTPGTGEIDSLEDVRADMRLVRAGMKSFTEVTNQRSNTTWKQNIRQLSRVTKFAEDYGVVLDLSEGQGGVPQSSTTAGEPAEAESD